MTTIGVLGQPWRAEVTRWGAVEPWSGGPRLDWWIAADDRWHVPAQEATVRQRRLDGTPVVETRVRIPSGDAVQRVYSVADDGGLTVVSVENASTLPIAVAFGHRGVLTSRPPADVPIRGIELPEDAFVMPVGHGSTVTVAIPHAAPRPGPVPDGLPRPEQVARGWVTQTDRASRLVVPDDTWRERVTAARCDVALGGLDDPDDDPVAFLLGAHELGRMGASVDDWIPVVVETAEHVGRGAARGGGPTWDEDRALVATSALLVAAHESRAVADVDALRLRIGDRRSTAPSPADGIRAVAWLEDRFARPLPGGTCALLPDGFPEGWLGADLECYHVPAGDGVDVSFAIRWHGERPAVLWEIRGAPSVRLTGGRADPAWSTTDARGDALLAVP